MISHFQSELMREEIRRKLLSIDLVVDVSNITIDEHSPECNGDCEADIIIIQEDVDDEL